MSMIYKNNDSDKMLFSELVMAYAFSKNSEFFYNEIIRRLSFCDFEEKMIVQMIEYELELIKTTGKVYADYLVNKKWWIENLEYFNDNNLLTNPLDKYLMYYNGEMSSNALLNSEIVAIYDEANFIVSNSDNFPSNVVNEAKKLSTVGSRENLRDEFVHRIEYIYKREFNILYDEAMFKKIMRFFINEGHILFVNKYHYDVKDNWIPYSKSYYDNWDY